MSHIRCGYCYNILFKEGPINVVVEPTECSGKPLYYEEEKYSICILIVKFVITIESLKIMVVRSIVVENDVTRFIREDDILVAMNGICFGVIPRDLSIDSWRNEFNKRKYPRLITFYRFHNEGDTLFNPERVVPFFYSNW